MQHSKSRKGLFVAPLVMAAIAAPVASAMPIDEPLRPTTAGAVLKDARQLDMHASTVTKPEAAPQDLRSEATVDATPVNPQTHKPAAQQDLRSENAVGNPAMPETPLGLPVWPRDPKPIVPVAQEPVATTGGGDDGIEWPLSGILIAGALLAGGTLGVAGTKYRVRQSHA